MVDADSSVVLPSSNLLAILALLDLKIFAVASENRPYNYKVIMTKKIKGNFWRKLFYCLFLLYKSWPTL